MGWKCDQSDRPDLVLPDLANSIVLEVKASEITQTSTFPSFLTLRFPRVVRVRPDKGWKDCNSVDDL
jgi:DNA ligase-4